MVPIPGPSLQDVPGPVRALAAAIRERGGRGYIVGGWVRDSLRGAPVKDLDVEVFGLSLDALETILATRGEVVAVGRAFGVLRVKGLDVDFSVPRRDSKVGRGHRGFRVEPDPALTPEGAVRRRDLTVNALLLDPLTGEILDPAGGLRDLAARRLRAVDPATFPEDPLRPLRVAQLAARLGFAVDPDLLHLCRTIDPGELPVERIWEEWSKMLLLAPRPSIGLRFLLAAGLLDQTPELRRLVGVPQDPVWHPEGDVWEHTLRAVDAAAGLREGDPAHDLPLMLGTLAHDLGKATTTRFFGGRWRSYWHDVEGAAPARSLLARIGAPESLASPVEELVRTHLQPFWLIDQASGARAYRRLARRLDDAGVSLRLLEAVARADFRGRCPDPEAPFPDGLEFLRRAGEHRVRDAAPPPLVLGRHLLARGFPPGPEIGRLLRRCREIQDETGGGDPEQILDEALRRKAEPPGEAPENEGGDPGRGI